MAQNIFNENRIFLLVWLSSLVVTACNVEDRYWRVAIVASRLHANATRISNVTSIFFSFFFFFESGSACRTVTRVMRLSIIRASWPLGHSDWTPPPKLRKKTRNNFQQRQDYVGVLAASASLPKSSATVNVSRCGIIHLSSKVFRELSERIEIKASSKIVCLFCYMNTDVSQHVIAL